MPKRLRLWGGLLFGVLLAGLGAVAVIHPTATTGRSEGLLLVAGGAALALHPRMKAKPAPEPGTIRTATAEVDGFPSPAVVIEVPRGKTRTAVGVIALFLVMSVAIALSGAVVLGGLCAAVCAFALVLGLRGLRRPATFALTERGIAAMSANGDVFVAWDEVAELYVRDVSGSELLVVCGERPPHVRSLGPRALTRRWGGDLSIPVGHVAVDGDRLAEAIATLVEEPQVRAEVRTGALERRLIGGEATVTPASTCG